MALTALTPEKMQNDIAPLLEDGEHVIASAFGLRVPSKAATKKMMIYGLIVLGVLLLIMMQDKVYLVVTNKRVLVLVLLDRIYKVTSSEAYRRDQISGVTYEKGSMYHNIELTAGEKAMRFKFFPAPMGLSGNGAQVEAMRDELGAN